MNINHNMDLIHILVFGAIIVGVLTYSYVVFVAPINEAYIKLLQEYYPELFIKQNVTNNSEPLTSVMVNGSGI